MLLGRSLSSGNKVTATGTLPAGSEADLKDHTLSGVESSLRYLLFVSSLGIYLTSLRLSFFITFKLVSTSQKYCGHLMLAVVRVVIVVAVTRLLESQSPFLSVQEGPELWWPHSRP